jgi:four helix bundle protein
MSFQNDIPIIQKVYDFYRELYLVIEKMPKKDKYTLGEKTQRATLDLIELLISAGYGEKFKKTIPLEQAAIKLDLLKLLVRLGQDLKAVPTSKYLSLEEKLQEIGRMLGGWIKSIK